MVVDDGFVEYIQYITEDFGQVKVKIPKRTQLRKEIVNIAADLRQHLKDAIRKGCDYYSMTSDIWTARSVHSYISLTLHYVDENFSPKSWTLEVEELPGIHDGEAISRAIGGIMRRWELPPIRCTKLLRDGASNAVLAGDLVGVDHMSGVAHSIHLVVSGALIKKMKSHQPAEAPVWAAIIANEGDAIKNENEEDDELSAEDRVIMEDIRDLAIGELDDYLDATLSSLERSPLDSVREIVQRFRSLATYFRRSPKARDRLVMIQRELLKTPPQQVVNIKVDCPTRWNSCWDMLQRFIKLQPAISKFFAYLASDSGLKEFNDKRNLFANEAASAGGESSLAKQKLVNGAVVLAQEEEQQQPVSDRRTQRILLSPIPMPQEADDFMNEFVFGSDELLHSNTTPLEVACDLELKNYLKDIAPVKKTDDPYAWWKKNHSKYPFLSKLARKWMGAVATSVPSERAFSTSGNVVTVKRSSLSPELKMTPVRLQL
ncbi:hypothetical protein FI667_g15657, partial [Globisporangium splendens]